MICIGVAKGENGNLLMSSNRPFCQAAGRLSLCLSLTKSLVSGRHSGTTAAVVPLYKDDRARLWACRAFFSASLATGTDSDDREQQTRASAAAAARRCLDEQAKPSLGEL